MYRNPDKLNRVDFHWFIVRTLPHQEKKLVSILEKHRDKTPNILEVYCPTHTTVNVVREGKDVQTPLFAGHVFVHATQEALETFIARYYPEGTVLYERKDRQESKKSRIWTIPEKQMQAFKDFNENYAEHVVILERPYSDYAFNSQTGEPNEIVRVIDGPLAGREGYIARFRRDKRLVFNMRALDSGKFYTVSIPNIWNFHVVRLHNAEGDRMTLGTIKERAADLLIGLLQGCGYEEQTLTMLYQITDTLTAKPSLSNLCRTLSKQGHETLSRQIAQLNAEEAGLILNLIRYEHDNPGYVRENWKKIALRPFLTPASGTGTEENETELPHVHYTEIIRKVIITEEVYYPSRESGESLTTVYYAHIGILPSPHESKTGKATGAEKVFTLFANWDIFLGEYFLTAGKANEQLVSGTTHVPRQEETNKTREAKLMESFRNFAPTLYKVLTGETLPVRIIRNFKVGDTPVNVLAATATATEIPRVKDQLIHTCTTICQEINTTTHLAAWRRYLRTVWLHR